MAVTPRGECFLSLAGVDLTAWVTDEGLPSHTRNTPPVRVPNGGKADSEWTGYKRQGRFTCELAQDFAANGPDSVLNDKEGKTFQVIYRNAAAAASAQNKAFRFDIYFADYSPNNGPTNRLSRIAIDAPISGKIEQSIDGNTWTEVN